MSNSEEISTFEELENRKRELELEVEVSQRELAHSLGTNRTNLNDYLLKRVALPIGGAIAGFWLLNKVRSSRKSNTHTYHEKTIVKQAPSDDPAKNHFPVPPPRTAPPEPENSYRSQRPKQHAAAGMTTINKDGEAEMRSEPREGEILAPKNKKHLINMASLASVAKIAVPAIKMIVQAVNDHKASTPTVETDPPAAPTMTSAAQVLKAQQ